MLVKKRKYSNFKNTSTEVSTEVLNREVEPSGPAFSILSKQGEIKALVI